MPEPTRRLLDLPAIIKALSEVPPERQRFVGLMVVALIVAWEVVPIFLAHFLH